MVVLQLNISLKIQRNCFILLLYKKIIIKSNCYFLIMYFLKIKSCFEWKNHSYTYISKTLEEKQMSQSFVVEMAAYRFTLTLYVPNKMRLAIFMDVSAAASQFSTDKCLLLRKCLEVDVQKSYYWLQLLNFLLNKTILFINY